MSFLNTFITNVTLVKEGNRISEQTFLVNVDVSAPGTATLETNAGPNYDYSIGQPGQTSVTLVFPPEAQSIAFNFSINSDNVPEGVETIQASSFGGFSGPRFDPPFASSTVVQSTEIRIMDNDCKLLLARGEMSVIA